MKIANNRGSVITKLGIGCVICLFLCFGILLYAQEKTKSEFIAAKPKMRTAKMKEINTAKMPAMVKAKEQAEPQRNRVWERQDRGGVDFGENTAFYKTITDHNLFHPLGWTPPNNESSYSLVGTAVDPNGAISQATLLEKRSNRYHFVTIGTKVGDMTVKDIQTRRVTFDKAGEAVTLKTGEFQPLTSKRERDGDRDGDRREGDSEKDNNNNRDRAEREVEKGKQSTRNRASEWRANMTDMKKRFQNASKEEQREMIEKFRRERSRKGRD